MTVKNTIRRILATLLIVTTTALAAGADASTGQLQPMYKPCVTKPCPM